MSVELSADSISRNRRDHDVDDHEVKTSTSSSQSHHQSQNSRTDINTNENETESHFESNTDINIVPPGKTDLDESRTNSNTGSNTNSNTILDGNFDDGKITDTDSMTMDIVIDDSNASDQATSNTMEGK